MKGENRGERERSRKEWWSQRFIFGSSSPHDSVLSLLWLFLFLHACGVRKSQGRHPNETPVQLQRESRDAQKYMQYAECQQNRGYLNVTLVLTAFGYQIFFHYKKVRVSLGLAFSFRSFSCPFFFSTDLVFLLSFFLLTSFAFFLFFLLDSSSSCWAACLACPKERQQQQQSRAYRRPKMSQVEDIFEI